MSLTAQGFERPTFDEIRSAIVERMRDIYGPINTGPESAIGQQIALMAEREDLLWQAQEAVYLSQYPDSAGGRSLDGAVQLTGVSRQGATRTVVTAQLSGDAGTIIPAGSQASTTDGDVFETVNTVTIGSGGVEVQMIALEPGPVLALSGTLTEIETPVPGWESITNDVDGETGRAVESDAELRIRRIQSLAVTGAGTVESIRARLLQQVSDVTAVSIIENRTDDVDGDGRPPHSFEAVVQGGIDQDIADLIWQVKPAGIETTGNISMTVADSQGVSQPIAFTRPVQRFIWVQVVLTPNGIGDFPADAEQVATDAIVEKGETLSVGDDVLYQSFFGPLYRNVPGLESATIQVGVSEDAETEPSYAAENISIAANEIALFLADRVTVTIDD
jgi:uncharacterized phage protein gp47/JayE